ncbi:MAG: hypothetical protein CMP23_04465 [Rickettsiales bacterium]|nr:hypothetical protein [Rickettsiales bacterium]|tara:strand:- start:674 stop:1267 length:594 start_codon:yes stop_codon:yes gene_type:complete
MLSGAASLAARPMMTTGNTDGTGLIGPVTLLLGSAVRLLLPIFLLLGCDPNLSQICHNLADVEPSLEVGTGRIDFEAIGPLTGFEFGPQGGLHIYASLRAHGLYGGPEDQLDETLPLLTYTFASSDGSLSGGFEARPRTMSAVADGLYERVGDPGILSTVEPSEAEGVEVEIVAMIADACGRSASETAVTQLAEGAF